jgi:hypothetical protein
MRPPLPIREGFMSIGPDLAKRFLEDAAFDGQRKTDPIYVARHLENLKRGLWLDGSQIAFAKVGSSFYLINGKHRLSAVLMFGKAAEFSIVVYECPDMDAVRSLYARFDSVQRARTGHQVLGASNLVRDMGVSTQVALAVHAAVPLLCNKLRPIYYQHKETDELRVMMGMVDFRIATALSWKAEAAAYQKCLVGSDARIKAKMLNAGVAAVALMTLRHAPQVADAFWSGLARNDGLRRGDPRHTLVQAFLSKTMRGREDGSPTALTAQAWNAFYRRKPLHRLVAVPADRVLLAGTPLDGRRG